MGEIADMMLDGMLCQSCGEYLGDGDGYPVTCAGCLQYEREEQAPKEPCDFCGGPRPRNKTNYCSNRCKKKARDQRRSTRDNNTRL
jgi:hypothetical protein